MITYLQLVVVLGMAQVWECVLREALSSMTVICTDYLNSSLLKYTLD